MSFDAKLSTVQLTFVQLGKVISLPTAKLIPFSLHMSIPLKTCLGILSFITLLLRKPPAIVGKFTTSLLALLAGGLNKVYFSRSPRIQAYEKSFSKLDHECIVA